MRSTTPACRGDAEPLPREYAEIPRREVLSLPHYGGNGCAALNIVPTDYVNGVLIDPPPADFNPRPGDHPGNPDLRELDAVTPMSCIAMLLTFPAAGEAG